MAAAAARPWPGSVQQLEPDHRGQDCGEDGVVAVVVAVAVLVAAVVAVFVAALEALAEVVVVLVLRNVIAVRSEEHTSELQSLMRISYAVFCLKKKNKSNTM